MHASIALGKTLAIKTTIYKELSSPSSTLTDMKNPANKVTTI